MARRNSQDSGDESDDATRGHDDNTTYEAQQPDTQLVDASSLTGITFARSFTPISEDEEEVEYAREARETRLAARKALGIFGGWLDNDKSGDYNPEEKRIRVRAQPQRRKRTLAEIDHDSSDAPATRQKPHSVLAARQRGIGFDFILKPQGLRAILLCDAMRDHWPDQKSWNFLTDEAIAFDTDDEAIYQLRSRRSDKRHNNEQNVQEEEVPDLKGHPDARGCKSCLRLHDRCSMLEPGATYPCEACVEEKIDCELNVEPKRKQACELCKARERDCSYEVGESDHSKPCASCSQDGFPCFAGPAPDHTRTRMTDDGRPSTKPPVVLKPKPKPVPIPVEPASSRYLRCTTCTLAKRRCSLNKRKPILPCKACIEAKQHCSLDEPKKGPKKTTKKAPSAAPPRPPPPPPQPLLIPRALLTPSTPSPFNPTTSTTTTITPLPTRLAHPIHFNHRHSTDCFLCRLPLHGLFGWGALKTARVSIWPDNQACTEISGGHVADLKPKPTLVCEGCTMARLLVCSCREHRLRQIAVSEMGEKGKGKGIWDTNAALARLAASLPRTPERLAEAGRWCVLCPRLATWECETDPEMPFERLMEAQRPMLPKEGCGLRLCGNCKVLFEVHRGRLNRMVLALGKAVQGVGMKVGKESNQGKVGEAGKVSRLHEWWPHGLRADFDWFESGGFLVQQCKRGFQIRS